jgi:hypothetical protein
MLSPGFVDVFLAKHLSLQCMQVIANSKKLGAKEAQPVSGAAIETDPFFTLLKFAYSGNLPQVVPAVILQLTETLPLLAKPALIARSEHPIDVLLECQDKASLAASAAALCQHLSEFTVDLQYFKLHRAQERHQGSIRLALNGHWRNVSLKSRLRVPMGPVPPASVTASVGDRFPVVEVDTDTTTGTIDEPVEIKGKSKGSGGAFSRLFGGRTSRNSRAPSIHEDANSVPVGFPTPASPVAVPSSTSEPPQFEFQIITGGRTWEFACSSALDAAQWLMHLRSVLLPREESLRLRFESLEAADGYVSATGLEFATSKTAPGSTTTSNCDVYPIPSSSMYRAET